MAIHLTAVMTCRVPAVRAQLASDCPAGVGRMLYDCVLHVGPLVSEIARVCALWSARSVVGVPICVDQPRGLTEVSQRGNVPGQTRPIIEDSTRPRCTASHSSQVLYCMLPCTLGGEIDTVLCNQSRAHIFQPSSPLRVLRTRREGTRREIIYYHPVDSYHQSQHSSLARAHFFSSEMRIQKCSVWHCYSVLRLLCFEPGEIERQTHPRLRGSK